MDNGEVEAMRKQIQVSQSDVGGHRRFVCGRTERRAVGRTNHHVFISSTPVVLVVPLISQVTRDSLASTPRREWLTNSSAPPRTDPYYSNPKSSTAYTPSKYPVPAPVTIAPSQSTPHTIPSPSKEHMPIDCSTLFSLARSKLQLSVQKDHGLHRWVLLKNSINSPSLSSSTTSDLPPNDARHSYSEEDDDETADEVLDSVTVPTFMFPDAGNFGEPNQDAHCTSEAQWLDSLLETLGDDDDDYYGVDSDPQIASSIEDDDEQLFSPSASPMNSSDDLPHMQPSCCPPPSVPYSVSFTSYPSSSADSYKPPFDSALSSLPPPYEDPLPYYDSDDVDDLAVPDAIDDTSDDESDAPQTPSLGRSTSPLSFIDAASIPLPPDRSNLRHAGFRVLFDEPSCFYPFDPLPFSDDVHSYNFYQEC